MRRFRLLFTMVVLAGMVVGIALWAWQSGSTTVRAELAFGAARPALLDDSGTQPNPPLLLTDQDPFFYPRDGSSIPALVLGTGRCRLNDRLSLEPEVVTGRGMAKAPVPEMVK